MPKQLVNNSSFMDVIQRVKTSCPKEGFRLDTTVTNPNVVSVENLPLYSRMSSFGEFSEAFVYKPAKVDSQNFPCSKLALHDNSISNTGYEKPYNLITGQLEKSWKHECQENLQLA
uniref:Uncharacterized protein n=1 Tax=Proboscia inermis TaxID=420281 RepID=A0A7S0G7G8_9STRA